MALPGRIPYPFVSLNQRAARGDQQHQARNGYVNHPPGIRPTDLPGINQGEGNAGGDEEQSGRYHGLGFAEQKRCLRFSRLNVQTANIGLGFHHFLLFLTFGCDALFEAPAHLGKF
jgi:hypothetical protein